jgi:CheY-like chemotaxis protein
MEKIRNLPIIPSVIFLDLKIRPHSGYEILTALQNDMNYQDTKVIALTASVMSHDVEQMKAAGFAGLISKPVVHRIFPELVNKILTGEPVWYIS